MINAKIVSAAEKNATAVTYNVLGTEVTLDIDFVKNYLVRGKTKEVTNQELVFFMNTCKAQKLNPLTNGEAYLIKYDEKTPAQMVVGKDAYTKRAFLNPDYVGKKDGIVVMRGNDVIRKEGCCLYPQEKLIGGWCRVTYVRRGSEREAFREVSLDEYNKGKSSWADKPATMINKVAIAQCMRDAFPADYEGIYSEDELIASGTIRNDNGGYEIVNNDGEVIQNENVAKVEDDPLITKEERNIIFKLVGEVFGNEARNDKVREILQKYGLESTHDMHKSVYEEIVASLQSKDDEAISTDNQEETNGDEQ